MGKAVGRRDSRLYLLLARRESLLIRLLVFWLDALWQAKLPSALLQTSRLSMSEYGARSNARFAGLELRPHRFISRRQVLRQSNTARR